MQKKPYTKKDFAWTQWTARDIEKVAGEILSTKKTRYSKIKETPVQEATFSNTVEAIEFSDYGIGDQINQIHLLRNASPRKSVRDAASKAELSLQKSFIEIEYDQSLYERVKKASTKKEDMLPESRKLLSDMLKGYKRMGFELPKAKRNQLKKNLKRITSLAQSFSKNVNAYEDHIAVTKEELDGLPQTYVDGLKKTSNGRYRISLDYPELNPFLDSAHSAQKREALAHKALRKGGKGNTKLLQEIIRLRRANARLLGYKTHADYKVELRTARSSKTVERFLKSLVHKVKGRARKDLELLCERKRVVTKNPEALLEYYDLGYYIKDTERQLYGIDANVVREYFPFQKVKEGTLNLYSKLLGVQFTRLKSIPMWDKSVELFEVRDSEGKLVSYFALDLYPRPNKYGHAAAFNLVDGHAEGGNMVPPFACMVANFPRPTSKNPSLMSHEEVQTFFHEFGHVMHHTLSKAKYASQSGFHVAWDFVEAPSQMFENWIWDEKILLKLSKHYKTGKPLPKKMLQQLIKTKKHCIAYETMRQLILALFDFTLHTETVQDSNKLYRNLVHTYTGMTLPKDQLRSSGFEHLVGGYDAGYYGYLWSRVYAQDMFTRFEKEGLMNAKTGTDYRKWVLEKGSSAEELRLVQKFLGRKPNNKAFLRSLGIKK